MIDDSAAQPASKRVPSADEVIALAQAGASVFYRRWACFRTNESEIRLDVASFATTFIPEKEVNTAMLEFDRELHRMGYDNPYVKRACNASALRSAEKVYYNFKAKFSRLGAAQ